MTVADTFDLSSSVGLERRRLHEQVADSLRELISGGQLQRGAQLPPERELAIQLGVSRATISHAIRLLEQQGLVEVRVGSGTFVTDKARSAFAESMQRLFSFRTLSFDDLMRFREMLEPDIAALAAERATADDLAAIKGFLEQAEQGWYDGDAEMNVGADADFHRALARATRNELVIAVTTGIHRLLRGAIDAQYRVNNDEEGERGIRSHTPVYEAVLARDPDRARRAMEEHMRLSRLALERVPRRFQAGEPATPVETSQDS
jgi:GntR family transcriptional repressor for pyruvate dehydrogenase complex